MNTSKKKPSAFLLVCMLLALTFLAGCTQEKPLILNDFSFTTLSGEIKHLSDYRGKVVILDMWATWCQPCQIQMLELRKVYENYSRNDVEILSINIDQRESTQLIQNFLDAFKNHGYELTWVFGKDDGSIWDAYKVGNGGIPAICIFDKKGAISFSHEGLAVFSDIPEGFPQDITKLAPIIDPLLK